MKVDLTTRDIELILSLLTESAPDEMYFTPSTLFTIEEISLIEKLASALKKCDSRDVDIMDAGSSGCCH